MAKKPTKKKQKRSQSTAPSGGTSLGGRKMKTSTKVVIVILAVIMALAMMLPSLASVVASNNQQAQQEEQQNQGSDDSTSTSDNSNGSSDDDSAATEGVPEDLQSLAKQYYSRTSALQAKLDDDPNNLAALLNLAQNYMNWGYQAAAQSDTDEETTYADGLLDQAIGYYDRYLALNDSNSAKVDRALCQYYKGDTDAAVSALQQITTDSPDFAPAWANLGMLYEYSGDTDKAKEAYQHAVDTDPNDEYGAKSFANRRLVQITASQNQSSSSDDATSVISNSSSDSQGLTDTLAQESGTQF